MTDFIPAFTTDLGALYQGDCIPWLKSLPSDHADLVFADPPFNLKKDYGPSVSDNMSEDDYLDWTKAWIDEAIRVLAPGGALWVYNIPRWAIPTGAHIMANHPEMMFRHQVAISMKNGLPIPGKLSPAHYSAIYFTKGKPKAFTRPRTPIETCRHCGGEIKDYGGHRNKMNPAGVNLTDIWTDLSPVRHRKTKHRSANALPEKMLERILSISTEPGDLVIDPFGGSGTTYAVAEMMGRHWQGIELGDLDPITARLEGQKVLFPMPNLGDAGKGKMKASA